MSLLLSFLPLVPAVAAWVCYQFAFERYMRALHRETYTYTTDRLGRRQQRWMNVAWVLTAVGLVAGVWMYVAIAETI